MFNSILQDGAETLTISSAAICLTASIRIRTYNCICTYDYKQIYK